MGIGGETYIFGKNIEDIKRAAHNFIVHKDYADLSEYINFTDNQVLGICALPSIRERRLAFRKIAGSRKLKDIQRLQQLEQLERLQQLERFDNIDILQLDYRSVVIPDNAVVYCDVPYTGTGKYGKQSFNHDDFWKWVVLILCNYCIDRLNFVQDKSAFCCLNLRLCSPLFSIL